MDEREFSTAAGRRIEAARGALGYSTAEMCELIGVSRPTYSGYITGRIIAPVLRLEPLVSRGITLDYLFFGIRSGLTVALSEKLAAAEGEAEAADVQKMGRPRTAG
ncbi:helix-turn-helix domain-containing protein [Azospirillum brasilense]|uniref:helix-turn-helix domain-containing protein n=1 Tax=Azospirillum brasilense TaxID=192 RepID=UPI00190AC96F|nr:helix-turn-helix transcriptional regulator [Azospirillum brasilense]MBK3735551.1 helix-turn-helix domain-containing protein [Azospirillum brasilense]